MHDFSTKIHLIIFFTLILSSINLCIFYSFRNEEKLVALLVYSSFRRVATTRIWNSSVPLIVIVVCAQVVVNLESLRIHYSTAAWHSNSNVCDVTRLVATEHVRNNCSLRESKQLKVVMVLIASL